MKYDFPLGYVPPPISSDWNPEGNTILTATAFLGTVAGNPVATDVILGTDGVDVIIISGLNQAIAIGNSDGFSVNVNSLAPGASANQYTAVSPNVLIQAVNVAADAPTVASFRLISEGTMEIDSPFLKFSNFVSSSPVGKFNVQVDGSGNVTLSSVANAGSGSGWQIGGNAGLSDPSIFGTLSPAGIDHVVNSISYLSVSSGLDVAIASSNLSMQSTGNVTLATSAASSLQIGFTGMPVQLFALTLQISTNSTINVNSASSLTVGVDSFSVTAVTGGAINSPALSIGNSGTSFMTIGNVACNTTIDSTLLQLPNMPAAVGGEQMVMIDLVTGQLRHT